MSAPNCPQCGSEYAYEDGTMYVCAECAHEWPQDDAAGADDVRNCRVFL
jgi:protein PhnA